MKSPVLILAFLSAGIIESHAQAAERRVVSAGGGEMRLDYSRSVDQKGRVLLVGRDTVSGKKFRFRISNGWVGGEVEGQRVRFHLSEVAWPEASPVSERPQRR